jgi:peptidoglycan/LPS O-acetylase OafA/YrhL
VIASAWCLLVALFAPIRWLYEPAIALLAGLPLVYLALFVGLLPLPKVPLFHRGDFSYGIYLYGFPIQQAAKSLLPGITSPWLLTMIAFPVIAVCAAFSWYLVEKPILKIRQRYSFAARLRLGGAIAVTDAGAPQPAPVAACEAPSREGLVHIPQVSALPFPAAERQASGGRARSPA